MIFWAEGINEKNSEQDEENLQRFIGTFSFEKSKYCH